MARNEQRRRELADAGLRVLAKEGSRGLTHRAVDTEALAPMGTTSNYFRSRELLLAGLIDRIGERLSPTAEDLAARESSAPGLELYAGYLRDIVRRLLSHPEVTLALFELRLEATRRPELAAMLGDWQRQTFDADVQFTQQAQLPGGARQIALLHYAIEGLVFDRLTSSIDPVTATDQVIDDLVRGLLAGP